MTLFKLIIVGKSLRFHAIIFRNNDFIVAVRGFFNHRSKACSQQVDMIFGWNDDAHFRLIGMLIPNAISKHRRQALNLCRQIHPIKMPLERKPSRLHRIRFALCIGTGGTRMFSPVVQHMRHITYITCDFHAFQCQIVVLRPRNIRFRQVDPF